MYAADNRPDKASLATLQEGNAMNRIESSVSRRQVAKWAAVVGSSFAAPAAAAQGSGRDVRWFSGYTDAPVTYFDVIEPTGDGSDKPPMFLIHGGAHTGACYLMTADGRPGWAHVFAQAGHRVVIPDWPGSGRSGHVPTNDLTGETVVAGLGKALIALGKPAVVMTHSMSGPYGWRLLEQYGDHVAKIVAVAPGPPGNIQAAATIASETPEKLEVRGTTSYTLDRTAPFVASPGFVESKLIGKSTQFPREYAARYAASLQPIGPRLLQERLNIAEAQMKVTDFSKYRDKRALVLVGTDDVDHPRELDVRIADWLNENGAEADFCFLGDRGVNGNGHMLMIERNSNAIAELILSWVERA
jgi:pimeloyl-ACP methyl ester carboxylesterase